MLPPKTFLRFCKNRDCHNFEIPMEFVGNQKRCNGCGHKTEYLGPFDQDTPPASYVAAQQTSSRFSQDHPQPNGKLLLMAGEPEPKANPGAPLDFSLASEGCPDIKDCPIAGAGPVVQVPWALYNKWIWLAHKLDVEWIALLKGQQLPTGEFILSEDGMYFPHQIATGITVRAEQLAAEQEGTIASVHSHVDMKAFFSGTDAAHFNHPVELVVNRAGVVDCVTRIKLRCGEFQRVRSEVSILDATGLAGCLKDLKEKLVVSSRSSSSSNSRYLPAHYSQDKAGDSLRLCSHGVPLDKTCAQCEAGANDPSDNMVRIALKVLDRRIRHQGTIDMSALGVDGGSHGPAPSST